MLMRDLSPARRRRLKLLILLRRLHALKAQEGK